MKTLVMAMVSLLLLLLIVVGVVISPGHGTSVATDKLIGGTIEDIDLAGLRVTIQTNLGRTESLPIANVDMIKGLTKGDQVNIELDEQGKVLKIIKAMPDIMPDTKSAPESKG